PESADWAIGLLVNVAAAVFKEDGMMLTPGMMINAKSGFIPESLNPKGLHILCIINCEFDMPDGKCEYLKFVPMDNHQLEEYMELGDNKAKLATSWYLERGFETCFKL
ncbi:MAG: suppressor of fused domain protein, partial [Planctomycetes bacterium]|nr:suppressor of fused domain protein [Planctomycetota bacterium]